jgi:hypothetical protein
VPLPSFEGVNVTRQQIKFGAILCLVAIVSFSILPLWQYLSVKTANAALQARVADLIKQHPELKPAWNIAMQDGVLTWSEAKEIVEGAGEKVESAP